MKINSINNTAYGMHNLANRENGEKISFKAITVSPAVKSKMKVIGGLAAFCTLLGMPSYNRDASDRLKDVTDSVTISTVFNNRKNAKAALESDISSYNAIYNRATNIGAMLDYAFQRKNSYGKRWGDYVEIISNEVSNAALGDISKRYNLQAGSLRHMVPEGGGEFDLYHTSDAGVVIYAKDLAEGLGISISELRQMFPQEQYN